MNASPAHRLVHAAFALGCGLLLAGAASSASAAGPVRQITVSYADLDLSRTEGAETLYRRLRAAARQVCGPDEARELARRAAWKECVDRAVAEAVRTVDRDALKAVHRQKAAKLAAG